MQISLRLVFAFVALLLLPLSSARAQADDDDAPELPVLPLDPNTPMQLPTVVDVPGSSAAEVATTPEANAAKGGPAVDEPQVDEVATEIGPVPSPAASGSYLFLETELVRSEDDFYDLSIEGIRSHLQTLEHADPEVFRRMDRRLRKLERRQRLSRLVTWGGVGLGAAMIVGGILTDGDPANADFMGTLPKVLFVGGLGVFGAGVGASMVLDPSREDVIEHINAHNRSVRAVSIRVGPGQVGVAGTF